MSINEIKKELYKQNPEAILDFIDNGCPSYHAVLNDGTWVNFHIPTSDLKDTRFYPKMEAKYLIRWLCL